MVKGWTRWSFPTEIIPWFSGGTRVSPGHGTSVRRWPLLWSNRVALGTAGTQNTVLKVNLQQSWAWLFFMLLFQFLSSLSYALLMCSVPSFHHRTLIFHCPYKQLNFWWAFAIHRVKFAAHLFRGCSSSSCCSEPSHLQHFTFPVPAFSSWDLLHFACLLHLAYFSPWNMTLVKNGQHYDLRWQIIQWLLLEHSSSFHRI